MLTSVSAHKLNKLIVVGRDSSPKFLPFIPDGSSMSKVVLLGSASIVRRYGYDVKKAKEKFLKTV